MVKIKVPATSANMGAGFDCLGVALGLYNYVYAEETDGGLKIDILDDNSGFLATDERNLVYRAVEAVYKKTGKKLSGIHLMLENNIMITRGLGSSSAGIVGGLLAGNALCGAQLTKEELLSMATEIEGHPDNVAPAILGGMTVNAREDGRVRYVKVDIPEDLVFGAFVPDFYLPTSKSRGVLPKTVSMADASFNISRSALLVSSIITGKYENIRTAVEDKLHQRYRKRFIPQIDELFKKAYKAGALGVYLSGAGPTVIAITEKSNTRFQQIMDFYLKENMSNWQLHMLKADNAGAVDIEDNTEV